MPKNTLELLGKAAWIAANPAGFLIEQIVEATSKNVSKADSAQDQELPSLRVEVQRQEFQMRMAEAQAKVAQEIAIAKRIESARQVEIEEFYDYSGEGYVGAKADADSLSIGLGGAGRRVSKRIYRFRGDDLTSTQIVSSDDGKDVDFHTESPT
jgi:hypothetical protein